MSKHTPGPWKRTGYTISAEWDESDWEIAKVTPWAGDKSDEPEANAYLIAAVIELLEIAKLFRAELALSMEMTGPLAEKVSDLENKVNAAIAKAEGRTA